MHAIYHLQLGIWAGTVGGLLDGVPNGIRKCTLMVKYAQKPSY